MEPTASADSSSNASASSSSTHANELTDQTGVIAKVTRWSVEIKLSMFALFYCVSRSPSTPSSLRFGQVLIVIQTLQLLSFAISPAMHFPWHSQYITWAQQALVVVRPDWLVGTRSLLDQVPLTAAAGVAAFVFGLALLGAHICYRARASQLRSSLSVVRKSHHFMLSCR